MNKKIAYLSHVPWSTIKQRPQFLAEQLSQDYKVFYIENKGVSAYIRRRGPVTKYLSIKNIEFIRVPWINPFKISSFFLNIFANCLNKLFRLTSLGRFNFDVIWITHPVMYEEYKSLIPINTKIIYDCMDDALEFKNHYIRREVLFNIEEELVGRAEIVICSAEHLRMKLKTRYKNLKNSIVINNAIEIPESKNIDSIPDNIQTILSDLNNSQCPLVYVGAVSTWFDFSIIQKVLDKYEWLSIALIGPCCVEIPKHERIKAYGAVDRQYIFPIMDHSFALIMPFQVNELIKSVNPVKLYEYIYTGKPAIAPRYGETEKFSDYVFLYDSVEELMHILSDLRNGNAVMIDYKKRVDFAKNNTWSSRYQELKSIF